MSEKFRVLFNLLLFQLGWLVCAQGNNLFAVIICVVILVLHLQFVVRVKREWQFIAGFALLGIAFDTVLFNLGLIEFSGAYNFQAIAFDLLPVWMICLWLIFATTVGHCLFWLVNHLFVAGLLAAFSAPLSYWMGSLISGSQLAEPLPVPLLAVGLIWMFMFPLGLLVARSFCFHVQKNQGFT